MATKPTLRRSRSDKRLRSASTFVLADENLDFVAETANRLSISQGWVIDSVIDFVRDPEFLGEYLNYLQLQVLRSPKT